MCVKTGPFCTPQRPQQLDALQHRRPASSRRVSAHQRLKSVTTNSYLPKNPPFRVMADTTPLSRTIWRNTVRNRSRRSSIAPWRSGDAAQNAQRATLWSCQLGIQSQAHSHILHTVPQCFRPTLSFTMLSTFSRYLTLMVRNKRSRV